MVEEEVAIGVEREIEDMTAVVAAKKKRGCVKHENDFSFFFLNRSQSQSSAVDGPPSTRRRSWSPSDTILRMSNFSLVLRLPGMTST